MHQNNADMIRPGCRGGHDQFNWESLRTMKYHDREQYLGQTTVIGYLDKGGKWRKKDWYAKNDNRTMEEQNTELKDELQRIKDEDERRLRVALGIEQPDDNRTQQMKLTKEEVAQLTKKTKFDIDDENDKQGLGSGPLGKMNFNTTNKGTNVLEACGVQDQYKLKVEEIQKPIKKEKKDKKSKTEKKEKNRDKKDKKEKKEKKHKKQQN